MTCFQSKSTILYDIIIIFTCACSVFVIYLHSLRYPSYIYLLHILFNNKLTYIVLFSFNKGLKKGTNLIKCFLHFRC